MVHPGLPGIRCELGAMRTELAITTCECRNAINATMGCEAVHIPPTFSYLSYPVGNAAPSLKRQMDMLGRQVTKGGLISA